MSGTRYLLIAGEASGDLLAAELVAAIRRAEAARGIPFPAQFFGAGGRRMQEAGVEVVVDMTPHAVIGVWEVVRKLGGFKRLFDTLLGLACERQPDVIVGVDYSGFNRRFARAVRRRVRALRGPFHNWSPRIVQYVSPQVWASRPGRAYSLARDVDRLLCLLPFEQAWYAARVPDLRVEFVGHPLVDRHLNAEGGMRNAESGGREPDVGGRKPEGGDQSPHPAPRTSHLAPPHSLLDPRPSTLDPRPPRPPRPSPFDPPKVVLLPGSRRGELTHHLPAMIGAARRILEAAPDTRFALVLPDEDLRRLAEGWSAKVPAVRVQVGGLAQALQEATVAIASTGTVTLECAWFGVPTVALYRTSWPTYLLARSLVTVDSLAMPNLLAGETVFPELIQQRATPRNIARETLALLGHPAKRDEVKARLARVVATLGPPGASDRAAAAILDLLDPRQPRESTPEQPPGGKTTAAGVGHPVLT